MPASARNNVDLPEPDGPLTSTRSPRPIEMSLALTSGTPFGSRTARSLNVTAARRRPARPSITGGVTATRARGRDRLVEAGQPLDHRAPFGQLAVDVDEDRQRVLHAAEGIGGLHQAAELDRAGEIGRADHDEGKHDRGLRIAGGEEGELLLPRHDRQPVGDHVAEAHQQPVAFGALAVEQGDLLGVLAHAHQVEAEIGFVALLLEIERDQRPADQMGERGADARRRSAPPTPDSRE